MTFNSDSHFKIEIIFVSPCYACRMHAVMFYIFNILNFIFLIKYTITRLRVLVSGFSSSTLQCQTSGCNLSRDKAGNWILKQIHFRVSSKDISTCKTFYTKLGTLYKFQIYFFPFISNVEIGTLTPLFAA